MGRALHFVDASDGSSSDITVPPYDPLPDHIESSINEFCQDSMIRATDDGRFSLDIQQGLAQLPEDFKAKILSRPIGVNIDEILRQHEDAPPGLNIVMQVVGSRGDVQPFLALGKELRRCGHRVRVATHTGFRESVQSHNLDFFDIGGDPAELMAYMVKNPGLIPKFISVQQGEVHKRRRAMRDIIRACWRACYEPIDDTSCTDNLQRDPKPFVADAIIANPPSFAHVHCAEKLGVPLHIIFTMPWSPTRDFAHPLAKIDAPGSDAKMANFLSYFLIDTLIWQGLGDIVNRFRRKILDLEPIDPTQAPGFLGRLRIPHTYCWSPSLVPKPGDWPSNLAVSGFFFLPAPSTYQPPAPLLDFLNAGPPPIYVGFGSIVVDDPAALTRIVLQAIRSAGVRAIISQGWGQLGAQGVADNSPNSVIPDLLANPNVFLISSCPHDWLFPHVSCVVHHGGAGTTAAGLAAGKPTVVVPFFGDQPFWGDMIHRYGAGPRQIPFKELTAENLASAMIDATTDDNMRQNAAGLKEAISRERGVQNAVENFHRWLPDSIFERCSPTKDAVAVWRYTKKKGERDLDIALSAMAATVLRKEKLINWNDLKLHRHIEYDEAHYGPHEPFSGAAVAVGDLFYDTFKGMGEICYEFVGMPFAGSRRVWEKNRQGAASKPSPAPNYSKQITQDSKSNTFTSPPGASGSSLLPNGRTSYVPGTHALKGTLRIGKAAARAPGTFTLAMARGAHNVPTLWGDRTVRPQEKVTGLGSGMKEGVKEFAFGVSDGISGLVMQPVLGLVEGGPLGFVKGFAKGVLGLPVKFFAAASGIVGYPLKGIDVEITNAMRGPDRGLTAIRQSRMLQGEVEYLEATVEERRAVVEWWQRAVMADK